MRKILLVEDNDLVSKCIRAQLEFGGCCVTVADNGANALSALETEVFDVVLTDIVMPDIEGFELILRIRQEDGGTPIIAMSGWSELDVLSIAKELGATRGLQKPFTLNQLLETIDDALTEPKATAINLRGLRRPSGKGLQPLWIE